MKRLDKLGLNADLLKDQEMKMVVGGSSADRSYDGDGCAVFCSDRRHPFYASSCDESLCKGAGVRSCECPD